MMTADYEDALRRRLEDREASAKQAEPQDETLKLAKHQQHVMENQIRRALHEALPFLNDDAISTAARVVADAASQHVRIMFGA